MHTVGLPRKIDAPMLRREFTFLRWPFEGRRPTHLEPDAFESTYDHDVYLKLHAAWPAWLDGLQAPVFTNVELPV